MIELSDTSPIDRAKVTEVLGRVRFAAIEDPDDPAFDEAWDLLAEGFLAQGELEPRDALASFLRERILDYGSGLDGSYHLVGAWAGDALVGVRDCYVDIDHREGVCIVGLAHAYVVPAWRRSGVAAVLRSIPLALARQQLAARVGRPLPTLVVAEMEPVDPADPNTVIRLLAYGRSGFSVLDPERFRYSQADFSEEPPVGHTALPLLGVVRPLEPDAAGTVPEHVAAAFPRLFYVCHRRFVPGARVDPSEAHVRTHLERGGTPVRLLPLPTSLDELERLAPLVRGAVLPLYPPGLRGPHPAWSDPREELARVRTVFSRP
ncbi:MAG: hypothetical protein H6738_15140 [Alphaproteobacteria bacterium]|nr:hypothetical protein [Alphaproteobacteria bacterium]MCB9698113.1 hypothetical protein [Alphaproteobacteria bacterium]